jgi:glycosyltransferase involved in cell wall biosynthesis
MSFQVVSISYGRNLFSKGIERDRQVACAATVTALHMVVFASSKQYSPQQEGNLFLYPSGGVTKVGRLLMALWTARKIIQTQRTNQMVVTTQDPFESGLVGYILSRLYQLPLIVQEHGDFFSTPHWRHESFLNRLRALFGLWLVRRATCVRVVSERIKTTLLSCGVARDRIAVLPVAIPVERFLQVARVSQIDTSITIITVARLVPQKNLPLLLRAFAEVIQRCPTARLTIVGEGSEKLALKTLALQLQIADKITWLPWSDDVPALLSQADIYVLSSNYEGYARVIPEAMAAGLPVVMTDVGCAHEVLHDMVHGLVVPVGDVATLASALETLCTNDVLRTKYSQAGRAAALAWQAQLSHYPALWRESLVPR